MRCEVRDGENRPPRSPSTTTSHADTLRLRNCGKSLSLNGEDVLLPDVPIPHAHRRKRSRRFHPARNQATRADRPARSADARAPAIAILTTIAQHQRNIRSPTVSSILTARNRRPACIRSSPPAPHSKAFAYGSRTLSRQPRTAYTTWSRSTSDRAQGSSYGCSAGALNATQPRRDRNATMPTRAPRCGRAFWLALELLPYGQRFARGAAGYKRWSTLAELMVNSRTRDVSTWVEAGTTIANRSGVGDGPA